MRWGLAAAVMLQSMRASAAAEAASDEDADLIPLEILEEPAGARAAPEASAAESKLVSRSFLEDAFTLSSSPTAVPVPLPAPPVAWQNRLSLDLALRWKPRNDIVVQFSDRPSIIHEEGDRFASRDAVRNAFREGYVAWQPIDDMYFDAGRLNLREGVALGFNPTDFFKTRTLVGQASLDPSVARSNRLGTLMARWQAMWRGGAAAMAFAPKVAEPSSLVESDASGFEPRFDATNHAHRLLCSISFDLWDLSPQLLAYFEQHRSRLGLNVTRPVGEAIIAYAEWTGGLQSSLITRALEYGQKTGTLPPGAPLRAADTGMKFRSDLAAGLSWTLGTTLTLNLEYHFHEGGFSRQAWRHWFDIGTAPGATPGLSSELWYLRAYANDQQEPVSRHQLFARAAWPRAFAAELDLAAFAFVNLVDGSVLAQLSASHFVSESWTASAYVSANVGDDRSEHGSFPQRLDTTLQLTLYF